MLLSQLQQRRKVEDGRRRGQYRGVLQIVHVLADDVHVVGSCLADGQMGLRVAQREKHNPVLGVELRVVAGGGVREAVRLHVLQQRRHVQLVL